KKKKRTKTLPACRGLQTKSEKCERGITWWIFIYDGIPNSTINLHLASKDMDMGYHTITEQNEYRYNYSEIMSRDVVYIGDFSYDQTNAIFDVCNLEIREIIGGSPSDDKCVFWLQKEDGYYLSNDYSKPYDDPAWMLRGRWREKC
nr:hypothetical protein [Tanacetum cinerariifolium]